jgi:hypothetical protein
MADDVFYHTRETNLIVKLLLLGGRKIADALTDTRLVPKFPRVASNNWQPEGSSSLSGKASCQYSQLQITVQGIRYYPVTETFPRIVTSGLPPGISRVTYDLDLLQCGPFRSEYIYAAG